MLQKTSLPVQTNPQKFHRVRPISGGQPQASVPLCLSHQQQVCCRSQVPKSMTYSGHCSGIF
uniref:Alternative protein n=1 Tax=Ascaris lumbricoides TaxID=6252 RepID=A0A0M3HMT2_ASCLU